VLPGEYDIIIKGVDTNEAVNPSLLIQRDIDFIGRYVSDDGWAANRNLTRNEALAYKEAGVKVVALWQNGKSEENLLGYNSGKRCAEVARKLLRDLGGSGQPIIFTNDFWPKYDDKPKVVEFYKGARSIIGIDRMGAYGPPPVMTLLFEEELITYGFQSKLWSPETNVWHPMAQLRKLLNDDLSDVYDFGVKGYLCHDRAVKEDYGGFIPKL
jgi:hypothetical protein